MKDIIFNLKKEYFEAIKSGVKKEEYRIVKDFWIKRLKNKNYNMVIIKLGYPKKGENNEDKVLYFKWEGYEIKDLTHKEFGEQPVQVFAIKLNNKIDV